MCKKHTFPDYARLHPGYHTMHPLQQGGGMNAGNRGDQPTLRQRFLSAAILEKGRTQMTHTQYLMRLCKGVYRVHPDVFEM